MIWVNGVQIDPGNPNITPATNAWVTDGLVRDYASWADVNSHAGGHTDHVGVVALGGPAAPPHTWVEFSAANVAGINVLGENHTEVRLEHVRAATGLTSFIYEGFASDDLTAMPNTTAAYNTENNARCGIFGIPAAPNHAAHGSESLFPKIAAGMVLLGRCLTGDKPVAELADRVAYYGLPVQRYLKIGWGFAKDVRAAEQLNPNAATGRETTLSQLVTQHHNTLDNFITGLNVDGYLGDQIVNGAMPHAVELLAVSNAILALLLDRSRADAGLQPPQQLALNNLPAGDWDQKQTKIGLWRNHYFTNRVTHAINNNVRFAGMGLNHMIFLAQGGHLPHPAHRYDMSSTGVQWLGFRQLTENRWANHH